MLTGLWHGVLEMKSVSSDGGDVGQLKDTFQLASDDAKASAVALNDVG